MATFIERISEIMYENGCNQNDICKKAKVPKSSMSSWMNGIRNPKADAIQKIAEAYNVSEGWLNGSDVPKERMTLRQAAESKLSKTDQDILDFLLHKLPQIPSEEKELLFKTMEYYFSERQGLIEN